MADPLYYGDDDLYNQQVDLQRRKAIADALTQAGQQPVDLPTNMKIVPRMGAGNALAKLGQILSGAYLQNQVAQGQKDLNAKQMAYLMQKMSPVDAPVPLSPADAIAFKQDQAGGPPSPKDLASPVMGKAASPWNPSNIDPQVAARMLIQDPGKWDAANIRMSYPTDTRLEQIQNGVPQSVMTQSAINRTKNAGMASVPAGVYRKDDGTFGYNPSLPPNAQANVNPATGDVSSVGVVPGSQGVVEANAGSATYGPARVAPFSVEGPNGQKTYYGVPNSNPYNISPQNQNRYALGSLNNSTGSYQAPQVTQQAGQQPQDPYANRPVFNSQSPTQADARMAFSRQWTQEQQEIPAIKSAIRELELARRLMDDPGAISGAPAEAAQSFMQHVGALFPGSKISSVGDAYNVLRQRTQNAANILESTPQAGGSDANSRAEARAAVPNASISGIPALKQNTDYYLGRLDQRLSHAQYLASHGANSANPDTISAAHNAFASKLDPDYFTTRRQPQVQSFPDTRAPGQTVNLMGTPFRFNGSGWEQLNGPN